MKRSAPLFAALCGLFLIAGNLSATVTTTPVEYSYDGHTFTAQLFADEAFKGPLSGIVMFPQWKGITGHEYFWANRLAEAGNVVLVVDMYGDGQHGKTPEESMALAKPFYMDQSRQMMRGRARAALDHLLTDSRVDPTHVRAIGFCFGGAVALELARSGAPLDGVVSFHGNLATPHPEDAANIQCPVLICHGADDPHVTWEEVAGFRKEMDDAGVDWRLVAYSGAVHAFTDAVNVGSDPSTGAAYNEKAANDAWWQMVHFFGELKK